MIAVGSTFQTPIQPLADSLRQAGVSVWLDKTEITWGDTITGRVNEALRRSRFVLLCLSRHFLARPWPEAELNAALALQNRQARVRLLRGAALPK